MANSALAAMIQREAADVANFAMFISDNARRMEDCDGAEP